MKTRRTQNKKRVGMSDSMTRLSIAIPTDLVETINQEARRNLQTSASLIRQTLAERFRSLAIQ